MVFLIQILLSCNCKRTKEKMYTTINGASCFRRLNGTHQTGCSSKFSGSEGILHLITHPDNFSFILDNPPSPPYAPVITPNLFTRENIMRLKKQANKYVTAIILINDNENIKTFSHELKCPNQYSNFNNNQKCDTNLTDSVWNPAGTGLMYEDFPFPIYYIADQHEIDKIKNCFYKFNSNKDDNQGKRSFCSIEINTFMSASINSEICTRRSNTVQNLSPTKYCDPLEGKNIFATLFHRNNTIDQNFRSIDKKEKFILISCRLDTTSMFDGVGLGAMDSLISMATLISLGHMLARLIPEQKQDYKMNILFAIFNGESYDYIGSQRFVYDLQRHIFPLRSTKTNPISLEQIEFMLDIGTLDQLNNITLYTANTMNEANQLLQIIELYSKRYAFNVNFNGPIKTMDLPPTSAQSFLKHNNSFPAIILNSLPNNKFYHSIYDDDINIDFKYKNTTLNFTNLVEKNDKYGNFNESSIQIQIRNVASILAMGLYEIITNSEYKDTKIANPVLVDEFLYCFLKSSDCPLFRAASYPGLFDPRPIPPARYISVSGAFQSASIYIFEILGLLLSQITSEKKKENCNKMSLYWYVGYDGKGECRRTTQHFSEALSPAFFEKDYDWKSGKYSTWTESTWQQFSARIYLRPSKIHEVVTLAIGFFIMVISFLIVFLINSRSDVLFQTIPRTLTLSEPAAC